MSVISLRNLSKTYLLGDNKVHALRDVCLEVKQGEFVTIIGPSGSGKSTMMHILGCLDRPTSGQFLFNGRDVSALPRDDLAAIRNKQIGFVFQGFNLLPVPRLGERGGATAVPPSGRARRGAAPAGDGRADFDGSR